MRQIKFRAETSLEGKPWWKVQHYSVLYKTTFGGMNVS